LFQKEKKNKRTEFRDDKSEGGRDLTLDDDVGRESLGGDGSCGELVRHKRMKSMNFSSERLEREGHKNSQRR